MPDEPSRVLGLAGLRVTRVVDGDDDALDLEVESVAHTEPCPHCAGADLVIKERPVVGVRDLPLAGRVARLLWRKRRWACRGCGRSHTERHPALPSRQRVSGRFRAHLATRATAGGAHAEIAREEATSATRWDGPWRWCPWGPPARFGGSRSTRPTTGAAASWRR